MARQHAADRLGDIGRRQRRSRHLVEQRHEQVIVVAVDDDDVAISPAESSRAGEPAEAGPHDHHLLSL